MVQFLLKNRREKTSRPGYHVLPIAMSIVFSPQRIAKDTQRKPINFEKLQTKSEESIYYQRGIVYINSSTSKNCKIVWVKGFII